MSAKCLSQDQCPTLHQFFPPPNCCICNGREKIAELEAEIDRLRTENESFRTQMEEGKQAMVMEILRLRGRIVSFPEAKTEPIGGKGEPVS